MEIKFHFGTLFCKHIYVFICPMTGKMYLKYQYTYSGKMILLNDANKQSY